MLKADTKKQIKAVCVVHNETTTGVTSDIPEVSPGGCVGGSGAGWGQVVAARDAYTQGAGSGRALLSAGSSSPLGCCKWHVRECLPITSLHHHCQVRRTMDAADHPALLLVDGVSSIGALDFQFDAWRVDVAVTGSQKALSIPTGLGMVCASDKVRWWGEWLGGSGAGCCVLAAGACRDLQMEVVTGAVLGAGGVGTHRRLGSLAVWVCWRCLPPAHLPT